MPPLKFDRNTGIISRPLKRERERGRERERDLDLDLTLFRARNSAISP